MTKWCSLLQLMVPLVVWLCEETERAVRARKYHRSISSTLASAFQRLFSKYRQFSLASKRRNNRSNTVTDHEERKNTKQLLYLLEFAVANVSQTAFSGTRGYDLIMYSVSVH